MFDLLKKILISVSWRVPRKHFQNKILNSLGLQLILTFSGNLFFRIRHVLKSLYVINIYDDRTLKAVNDLNEKGITIINDFLDLEDFYEIKNSFKSILQNDSNNKEIIRVGNIRKEQFSLNNKMIDANKNSLNKYENNTLKKLINNKTIKEILSYADARFLMDETSISLNKIYKTENKGEDSEAKFHQDHFFPVFKVWLLINDSKEERAALKYIPSSHKLNFSRILFIYKKSIFSRGGSWSIDEKTLNNIYESAPISINEKQNTLVIANTFGFHARGVFKSNYDSTDRIMISHRMNPFIPF